MYVFCEVAVLATLICHLMIKRLDGGKQILRSCFMGVKLDFILAKGRIAQLTT